jgi:hypothetical protein
MSDATAVPFDPDALAGRLPAGALRYLTHAIRPGAHADGRIRLLGALPIVTRRGPDADRAMRGRLVVESVWLPSAFLPDAGAVWSEEHDQLRISLPVHGDDVQASLRVGPAGELRELRLDRWSDLTEDRAPGSRSRPGSRPSGPLATTPSPRSSRPPGGREPTASSSSSAPPSSRLPSCRTATDQARPAEHATTAGAQLAGQVAVTATLNPSVAAPRPLSGRVDGHRQDRGRPPHLPRSLTGGQPPDRVRRQPHPAAAAGVRGGLQQLWGGVPAPRRDACALPGARRGRRALRAGLQPAAGRDAVSTPRRWGWMPAA